MGSQQVPQPGPQITVRRAVGFATLTLLVVVLAVFAGDSVQRNIGLIETALAQLGHWGVAVYLVFAVVAASLLVPETVIGVLAGVLFGPRLGLAAAFLGFMLASCLQYLLGHRLLRAPVQQMVQERPTLAAIQRVALTQQKSFQVLLRLTPLNPALVSYAMGAADVRFLPFLLGCVAYLPHLVLEVYFGNAGRTVVRSVGSAQTGGASEGWPALLGVLLGVAALAAVSHRAYRTVLVALEDDAAVLEDAEGDLPRS